MEGRPLRPSLLATVVLAAAVPAAAAAAGGAELRVGYVGAPLAPGLAGPAPAARLVAGATARAGAEGAPFRLVRLAGGDAALARNPAFRGPAGAVDAIAVRRYAGPAAAFADLEAGRLDALLDAPASLLDAARRDRRLRAFTPAAGGTVALAFAGPADAAVTAAVRTAVDRAAVAASLGTPLVRVADGAGGGLAAARRTLARAGWICPQGGLCERGGVRAVLALAAPAGDADAARALAVVAAAGRAAGVDVRVVAPAAAHDGEVATLTALPAGATALVVRERLDVVRTDTWRGYGAGGEAPLAPAPAALAALRPGSLAQPALRGPAIAVAALVAILAWTLGAARRRRLREDRAPRERAAVAA